MHIPDLSSDVTIQFCRGVADNSIVLVPLRPLADKPLNECFSIVPEHIVSNGGEQVFGWAIWEWPGVFIEAEFHCIWQTNQGEWIDITPKPKYFDYIAFVPDTKKSIGVAKSITSENLLIQACSSKNLSKQKTRCSG